MLLYNRNCEVVAETIIDKDDIPYVKDIKWHLDDKGYVVNRTQHITLKLHNYIMNHNDFTILVVDHINNNRLDNRKSNLRIVTKILILIIENAKEYAMIIIIRNIVLI